MSKRADELLRSLEAPGSSDKGATVRIDAATLETISRWRRPGQSLRDAIQTLIVVASETLDERQAQRTEKVGTRDERS